MNIIDKLKNRKVILIIVALILIIIGVIFGINSYIKSLDSYKFKTSYEALNNTVRDTDNHEYNNVSINVFNPIKYITDKEAVDLINSGEGIIYFGAPWCPWCRNAVPVLFDALKSKKVKTLYYVDIDTVKNVWEIKNNKLIKTKKESKYYYELLEALDNILGDKTYTITGADGNTLDTGEKRIYVPMVIAVKNGEITGYETETITLNQDQDKYSRYTKKQEKEVYNKYIKVIDSLTYNKHACNDTVCN